MLGCVAMLRGRGDSGQVMAVLECARSSTCLVARSEAILGQRSAVASAGGTQVGTTYWNSGIDEGEGTKPASYMFYRYLDRT